MYRDVWHRIEVVDESVALVGSLRRAGYGVHLGTNQERERGEHMRDALGYDALFDDPVVPRRRHAVLREALANQGVRLDA
ncbi:hypothetical protein CBR64_16970 [Cellulosimicrobium cellulans]|uniref:Uncharacterized protein n=1 Tax=Cellulosimicrobium cellulans TaxID=1710 RepID=A0A1Y0I0G4_CELCE|nr:hypothetical protein [Cellulosimicrobium cellulans]ARU52883.1 hypothetical protein CBR64_16970 [Cellulosimicrobium cellulans]